MSECCIHDCLFALLTALQHLEVKITNEVRESGQVLAAGHVLLLFEISIFSDDDMSSRS